MELKSDDSSLYRHQQACKATIIILTYNQEKTISRAIDSVLRQNCDCGYEILIADDGSSDGTRRICEDYSIKYPGIIRLMPKVPNKGIVDNYFDALLEARGEYVGDCAGDDEWLDTGRLQRQIKALDKDTSLSTVCCDVEACNAKEGKVEKLRGSLFVAAPKDMPVRVDGKEVLREVLNHTNALPFVLSGALYRRKPMVMLLKECPEILRCHDGGVEDVPLIAALGAVGDVEHLPILGYRYYIDGESVSNNLSYEKEYRFVARIVKMVRRLGKIYGLTPKDQKRFFNAKFPYLAAQAHHAGEVKLGEDLLCLQKEWNLPMPLRGKLHLWLLKMKLSK